MIKRRHISVVSSGVMTSVLLAAAMADANIVGGYWSTHGHTLQSGSSSNMVGFWQALGTTKICVVDGIFGPQTLEFTKRMQAEVAYPPIAQTGIVDSYTWNSIQSAQIPPEFGGGSRLYRTSGSGSTNGTFSFYNGQSSGAELYWQGTNTGTGSWKFLPAGASGYIVAETNRTMGSYPTGAYGC